MLCDALSRHGSSGRTARETQLLETLEDGVLATRICCSSTDQQSVTIIGQYHGPINTMLRWAILQDVKSKTVWLYGRSILTTLVEKIIPPYSIYIYIHINSILEAMSDSRVSPTYREDWTLNDIFCIKSFHCP